MAHQSRDIGNQTFEVTAYFFGSVRSDKGHVQPEVGMRRRQSGFGIHQCHRESGRDKLCAEIVIVTGGHGESVPDDHQRPCRLCFGVKAQVHRDFPVVPVRIDQHPVHLLCMQRNRKESGCGEQEGHRGKASAGLHGANLIQEVVCRSLG